ncbi:MAG: FAD:protein FMN transferase [Flavobacteriales bacterium]|nr:FAD:protein FMN transferase [Flavobacteriales bacterium]
MRNFKIYLLLLSILMTILFISCEEEQKEYAIKGNIFGSTYMIKYYGYQDYQSSFDSIFNEINSSVNTYDNSSLLSKWNNSDGKDLNVNQHIKNLVSKTKYLNTISDGFYDPTVSPLVNFYGFGSKDSINNPTQKQIDSLLSFVGMQKVKLQNNTLIKENINTKLEFNSIAPGYTADLIGSFLLKKSIDNFIIDVGGEILAHGKKDNKPWKVGIEDPTHSIENRAILKSVTLTNKALATSGSYRKVRLDENGNQISHTINPKTGKALTSNLLSVTIIANDCATADGVATACMAMGLEKSRKMLTIHSDISAFFILQEDGELKTETVNNFQSFLLD